MFGQYCQESYGECITMGVCSILMVIENLRILVVLGKLIFIDKQDPRIKQKKQGDARIWSFLCKSLFTVMLLGTSATQITMWLFMDSTKQSIMLFSVFCINLVSCLFWLIVLILERRNKGFTTKSTKASVSINFCLNTIIAILSGRNSFDSSDNYGFYCYVGYLGAAGLFQIILSVYQKDFDFIQIENQISNDNNNESNNNTIPLSEEEEIIKQESAVRVFIEEIRQTVLDPEVLLVNESELLKRQNEKEKKQEEEANNDTPQGTDNQEQNNQNQIYLAQKQTNSNEEVKASPQTLVNNNVQGNSVSDSQTPGDSNKGDRKSDFCQPTVVCPQQQKINQGQGLTSKKGPTTTNSTLSNSEVIPRGRIQNIQIEGFTEMIKYKKKTMVFEIKYNWSGKLGSIKRSFREFETLNNNLKQIYKCRMPIFPSKKDQNTSLTKADLVERKTKLCAYLQVVNNFCQPEELLGFLQSSGDFLGNNTRSGTRNNSENLPIQVTIQAQIHSNTVLDDIQEEDEEQTLSSISPCP